MAATGRGTRLLIDIALRRQRPGSGSSLDFLKARTYEKQFPDLAAVLGGIPWAVVGAAAVRHYMPERGTRDLDILVPEADASLVRARLQDAGYSYRGEPTVGGSAWPTPKGFPIDVIECRETWCEPALEEAAVNTDPAGNPILPLSYLVLQKLQAGRVQDLADVSRMLGLADAASTETVRLIVARWRPQEMEDLESLIKLGRLETGGA